MSTRTSWWRRNLVALIAVVVLGTGAVLFAFAYDWQSYQNANPTQPVDIARGGSGELAGGTFSIGALEVLPGDTDDGRRHGITPGTDVVVLDLDITPRPDGDPDDYVLCEIRLRAPSPAGEREWWPQTFNPTTYPEPEAEGYGCDVAGGDPYRLRQYFVVPAGGAEGAHVLVTVLEELPRALRLH